MEYQDPSNLEDILLLKYLAFAFESLEEKDGDLVVAEIRALYEEI